MGSLSNKDIHDMLEALQQAGRDSDVQHTKELEQKIDFIKNLLKSGLVVMGQDRSVAVSRDTSGKTYQLGSKISALIREKKQIFISYRRDDSGDIAGRIYEHLARAFGEDVIFFDVLKSIPYGQDFEKTILAAISQVKIMLVIMGNQWCDIRDKEGRRRLEQTGDWVRREVETGLARQGLPVIPIYTQNASVRKEQLPPSLQPLLNRNGLQIRREPDFMADISRLIDAIASFDIPQFRETGSIPGKPYQIWDYTISPTDTWLFYLMEDPQGMRNKKIENRYSPGLKRVSLSGNIKIGFEIGNFDRFAQLNLKSLDLRVTRSPIDDPCNVWALHPGLGGREIRRYEGAINYDISPEAPAEQLLALQPVKGAGFDYLAIAPGEREVVEASVNIPLPGIYTITPVATIRNRESECNHEFDGISVAVPHQALIWHESDAGLEPSGVTIHIEKEEMQIKGMMELPCDVPILVQGSISFAVASIFILYGSTLHLPMIRKECPNPEPHWSPDGNEILFHDGVRGSNLTYYSYNLKTGKIKHGNETADEGEGMSFEQKNRLADLVGEYSAAFWSPDGKYVALIIPDKDVPLLGQQAGGWCSWMLQNSTPWRLREGMRNAVILHGLRAGINTPFSADKSASNTMESTAWIPVNLNCGWARLAIRPIWSRGMVVSRTHPGRPTRRRFSLVGWE